MTVWTVVTGIAVLIAAGIVARGAAAKESLKWLKERVEELTNDNLAKTERIKELETKVKVLEGTITNSAAIEHFAQAISNMSETNAKEHADLAAAFGRAIRDK